MGKRTKKTRWRTLSIGDAHSEGEATPGAAAAAGEYGARKQHPWRAARAGTAPWHSSSTHSTPERLRQNGSYRGQRHYGQGAVNQHGDAASKSTTRSSSSVSERKITFNEDEYTRITTPRQDVLFKKGYLSRPKPHMQHAQRPLTSAGNSTGDGTPDHQSADGTEYNDGDLEQSPFIFPGAPPFMDANGGFFVNGFEPFAVPPAHVLVYDQFGNAAVCFPPPHPHLPQPPAPEDLQERRLKRYSTDSMPESSSPHGDKPRHRRRPKPAASDADESSMSTSSLSGNESDAEDGSEAPSSSPKPIKYRVDAEEFVPRAFRTPQPIEFMPLPVAMSLPPELYPGAFLPMFVPPPFFHQPPPPHHTSHQEVMHDADDIHEEEEEEEEEEHAADAEIEDEADGKLPEKAAVITNSIAATAAAPIDIAKIVSKLEQAALEQKRLEKELLHDEREGETPPTAPASPIKSASDEKTEPKPPITIAALVAPPSKQAPEASASKVTQTATCAAQNGSKNVRQPPRYSERLKLPAAKPMQQHKAPATPPASKNTNSCPRFDRQSRQQNTKPTATPPVQRQQTPPTVPDQWISVSGKKKRGKNKASVPSSQLSGTDSEYSEAAVTPAVEKEEEEKIEEQAAVPQLVSKPEEILPPTIESVVTPKRERKASKKTPARKRIIITDGPIAPLSTAIAQPSQEPEQIQVKTAEKCGESAGEDVTVTAKSASKKKKKNKSKLSAATTNNNSSDELPESTNHIAEKEDLEEDHVSEELARMIERGLCGPLEERLRSFNPSDSFLMDGLRPRRTPAALKPFESIANATLKRPLQPFGAITPPIVTPRLVVTAAPAVSAMAPVREDSVPPISENGDLMGQRPRFPITRAVREWMNRTRETTPEVEIFKKPDEIRQEFLVISDDEEVESALSAEEEVMEKGEDLINHRRCSQREPSADLLDCWEPDVCLAAEEKKPAPLRREDTPPPAVLQEAVEEAEDALDAYESVYRCSGDLERIQREVQGAQRLRHPRGDGGLPYRAICCSVM